MLEARESVRELMTRGEDLSYRLGRSEARAASTERAESMSREERGRLLRELVVQLGTFSSERFLFRGWR